MTTTTPKTVTVSREKLYAQVWTTPMRKLANEYGLSDVGLAKVCKRHDIPRPPVGYWAKKEVGKAPPQPPLPKNEQRSIQQIKLWDGPQAVPAEEAPADYDPDIQELLAKALALPHVVVAQTLHNLHPLVRKAYDEMENRSASKDPVIAVHVRKPLVRRALLFLDALFKAIEKIGGEVTVERPLHWKPALAAVKFAGTVVTTLRIRERYKKVERQRDKNDTSSYGKYEDVPTGRLLMDREVGSYEKPHCEDTEKSGRLIEDQINQLIIRWVHELGQMRIDARHAAEQMRIRAEQERLRQEREAELKRRRDELLHQQKIEQAKVDRLLEEAANINSVCRDIYSFKSDHAAQSDQQNHRPNAILNERLASQNYLPLRHSCNLNSARCSHDRNSRVSLWNGKLVVRSIRLSKCE